MIAALSVLAAIPAAVYAVGMLALARQAGPSCFLGQCAYGDRLAQMAGLAIAIVLVGLLAALRTRGWRVSAWCVGAAAVVVGLASIALPAAPGSLGQLWGAAAVGWGALFIVVAEREARRVTALH